MKMYKSLLLIAFVSLTFTINPTTTNAQPFGFEQVFQGPWNSFAHPQRARASYGARTYRSVGAPHPDLRCGYWLMKKFGLSDRRLWRAYAWKNVGRPSNGSVGDVAVMRRSHVGYVSGHCAGGGIQLTSYGNSRIGVFTKCYPRSAFQAFRRL